MRPLPPDLPAPLALRSQLQPPIPEPRPDNSRLHNPRSHPLESEKSDSEKSRSPEFRSVRFRSGQPPASHSETATHPAGLFPYQPDILPRPHPRLPEPSAAYPEVSKSANQFR